MIVEARKERNRLEKRATARNKSVRKAVKILRGKARSLRKAAYEIDTQANRLEAKMFPEHKARDKASERVHNIEYRIDELRRLETEASKTEEAPGYVDPMTEDSSG